MIDRNGPATARGTTLLVLSQAYVPDPASVGQHMADAAAEMARRGWRVIVLTSRNGYDDPSSRYAAREIRDGVEVHRLPWCSFGKRSMMTRLLSGFSFVLQAIVRGLSLGRVEAVLVSTGPPIASLAALVIHRLRGAALKFWVMDLNPDQLVALGRIRSSALPARLLDWLNRRILARATDVVVLDRFMARRISGKRDVSDKLAIIPPWPLEDHLAPVAHGDNPFRSAQGLEGKLVVMYSGNHGPSHPFSTILSAAARLREEPRLLFMFIGGGVAKRDVEAARLPNVRSLPYQPLTTLRYSLSAADIHLVTLGDEMVGIVHPCKVYGAMAVARPILLLGPERSHVGDLLAREPIGWVLSQGDVDGAVQLLTRILALPVDELVKRGQRARAMIDAEFSKALLCGRLCDRLERVS
jgi:colanic acid biosynthesis glycosyl transferase WcaI